MQSSRLSIKKLRASQLKRNQVTKITKLTAAIVEVTKVNQETAAKSAESQSEVLDAVKKLTYLVSDLSLKTPQETVNEGS